VAVSAHASADAEPDDGRLDAIAERVAALQRQTELVMEKARDAMVHTQSVRAREPVACSHAGQVTDMQSSLAELSHEIDGLRAAMAHRGVIEQAKGMLMMQRPYTADEAFAELVRLSQASGRKLFAVAETVVATWAAPAHAP